MLRERFCIGTPSVERPLPGMAGVSAERRRAAGVLAAAVVVLAAFGAAPPGEAAPVDPAVPEGSAPCEGDGWGPPGARMFLKFDTERRGRVDLAQFVGHREGRFRSLDADGDGRVTIAEHLAADPSETADRLRTWYGRFDLDGDGAISLTEWNAGEAARFERIDTNRDGFVTREEFLLDRARLCAAKGPERPRE